MRTILTQQEIAAYRENGHVSIPDFLDPAELAAWRTAVMDAVTKRGDLKTPDKDWKTGDSYYDYVFIQRLNLWQDSLPVRALMLDERIGRMCCDLAGIDGIRIWHDQALIKAPWANPTAWHLDTPYWSFSDPAALSIWIALDDATLENGCMWFIPGSNKVAKFDNVGIGNNMGDLFKLYPAMREMTSVSAVLPAGGASFHNGLLAHGAGANMTKGWRRAMTCAFMPDGGTFNGQQNILPQPLFDRLKPGDVLDNPDQNPLLYHRSKEFRANLERLRALPGPVEIS